jgi:SAM-dependent methyltransferase
LARHFEEAVGVDVSRRMVDTARELNSDVANCSFFVNRSEDLGTFETGTFDLIYTTNVLHHLPSQANILAALSELARLLAPGGLLAFQVATFIPPSHRLQPRRRIYSGLRKAGVSPIFLYRRLRLHPMRMTSVSHEAVVHHLTSIRVRVLEDDRVRSEAGSESATYYCTK